MNNLNSFIMDGRLADDPTEKEFDGKKTVEFKVEIHRTFKNVKKEECEEVVKIPVLVYDGMQKACLDYLKKGDAVRVMGRIRDIHGDNGSDLGCVAERIDFLSKKKRDEVITIDVENGAVNTSSGI